MESTCDSLNQISQHSFSQPRVTFTASVGLFSGNYCNKGESIKNTSTNYQNETVSSSHYEGYLLACKELGIAIFLSKFCRTYENYNMAEFVLETALGNLNSLVQKELGLFLGFDQDLERLTSLFTTIKATLEDAEEKQFSDRAIKDWLGKLQDAAYELDDIIDECAYEALALEYQGVKCGLSDKVQCSCLSSFHPKHVVSRYKIAKKMKRISQRLIEIAEEREKFHLNKVVRQRRSEVIQWRQTISSITEPQIYGREEDKDKIINFLIGDASNFEDLSVYPIVGLGGLGKTALAQFIFNHKRVVDHFELRIWVCVSEDFSLKRMTKAIIEAASGKGCEDLDPEPLNRRLQDLLQRKRYLLVLDDVWDDKQENWQKLKSGLTCGAKGASILVTTRLKKAFGPNEVEQVELEDIGKEIVKKFRGVPLAAKALGGLLRFKRKKNEWLNVKESNFLELSHDENSIISVLRLSYLNLPIKLRQCFAYCAIFPKDHIIERQYLIELWMANGFISSNEILDVEDVGDDVWNELYLRSFFQDIETDEFGKVTHFKMHDLVHDLAQSIAEDVCCVTEDNDVTASARRIHHLSDHRWMSNSIPLHQVKSSRTYLLYYGDQLCPHILKLDSCYNLQKLPNSLIDLKALQHLSLNNCTSLSSLPNSLIDLKALQHLSLNDCFSLSSLPPRIGKLTSLRNLTKYFVGEERGFLLAELGALKLKGDLHVKNLQNVKSVMDAREAGMSSKKLNKLQLSWDDMSEEWELQENIEEILEVLKPNTQQLESLTVKGYKGAHLPQWTSSPSLKCLSLIYLPNLIRLPREEGKDMFSRLFRLQICGCHKLLLEEELLQGLHSLKELDISECDKFNMSAGFLCLTSLEKFSISDCIDVEGLNEALHLMTALKDLTLWYLPNLESLPDCFGNLPLLRRFTIIQCSNLRCLPPSLSLSSLHRLAVEGCSSELMKQFENKTGEDWSKVAHIPNVILL
ncbi:Disease resistance protein RGA2, partial [Mucuna pruriens]